MCFKIPKFIALFLSTFIIYTLLVFPTPFFPLGIVNAAANEELPNIIYGDVSGDEVVNSIDFTYMKKYLLMISALPAPNWQDAGDVNLDGTMDSVDYSYLKKYLLGQITVLPITNSGPTETPFPDWDKIHTGYATYTGSGYTGGTAMLDPISPDMEITALNNEDYYSSYGVEAALAGAYLEVTGEKGSTVVYVCDLYPEGGPGALDLCPTSFAKIGDMSKGRIDITWRIVPAPITGNISFRIKEGSTRYWLALQVRNHLYPVLKMEYYDNGQWITMKKMFWNYFMTEKITTTTPTVRLTDIRGYVITDVIRSIPDLDAPDQAYDVPGNVQFPK